MAAVAAGLGLVAAGCGAGQITQTDTQVAVVNGASGSVGPVVVRDAQFVFPVEHGSYEEGDAAPITALIANNGADADRLLAVTSDAAESADITGDAVLEPSSAILFEADESDLGDHGDHSASPSPTGSSSPSATTTTTPSGSTSVTGTTTPSSGSATTTTEAESGSISNNPPTTATKTPSSVDPTEPGTGKIVLKGLKRQVWPGQTVRVTFLFEKAGELTLEVPIGATSEPRQGGESGH